MAITLTLSAPRVLAPPSRRANNTNRSAGARTGAVGNIPSRQIVGEFQFTKPWFPKGRSRFACVFVDGGAAAGGGGDLNNDNKQIYLFGGSTHNSLGGTKERAEVMALNYRDISSSGSRGKWCTVGKLGTSRSSPAAASLGGGTNQVVVVGGSGGIGDDWGTDSVELYDVSSNITTDLPRMHQRRRGSAAISMRRCPAGVEGDNAFDGDGSQTPFVYVFGGCFESCGGTAELFDATTQTWYMLPRMPARRTNCSAAALNDHQILVVGGMDPTTGRPLDTADLYDISTNRWRTLPRMAAKRAACAAASVPGTHGRYVVVVGGEDEASVELYDAQANSWTLLPCRMNVKRSHCAALVVAEEHHQGVGHSTTTRKLVVIGGTSPGGVGMHLSTEELCLDGYLVVSSMPPSVADQQLPPTIIPMSPVLEQPASPLHAAFPLLPPIHLPELPNFVGCVIGDDAASDDKLANTNTRAAELVRWAEEAQLSVIEVEKQFRDATRKVKDDRDSIVKPLKAHIRRLKAQIEGLEDDLLSAERICEERLEAVNTTTNRGSTISNSGSSNSTSDSDVNSLEREDVRTWLANTKRRIKEALTEASALREEDAENYNPDSSDQDVLEAKKDDCEHTETSTDLHMKKSPLNVAMAEVDTNIELEEGEPEEEPDELCCKITGELMVDPVIAMDGHTYERKAVERWYWQFPPCECPRSPVTNDRLPSRTLLPNHTVRKLCRDFQDRQNGTK